MQDYAALRRRLVDNQIRPADVTEYELVGAFLDLPRELFVAPGERPFAYSDRDVRYSEAVPDRWMMDAVQLARLIQTLSVQPDHKAMVIGCGTGYSAAILARLSRTVIAVEQEDELAASAEQLLSGLGAGAVVVREELTAGCPGEAPYDSILFDGAVEIMPDAILSQLKPHGTLAVIEKSERISHAMLYERVGGRASKRPRFEAWAAVLPGFERKPEFVF